MIGPSAASRSCESGVCRGFRLRNGFSISSYEAAAKTTDTATRPSTRNWFVGQSHSTADRFISEAGANVIGQIARRSLVEAQLAGAAVQHLSGQIGAG